jgi:hypothetical protein
VLRRHLRPLACLALAGLIGVAAIVDHRWKQDRIDDAQLKHWYCVHLGTQCDGPSWRVIEKNWNERQVAYEVAVAVLAGGALAWGGLLEARRRR